MGGRLCVPKTGSSETSPKMPSRNAFFRRGPASQRESLTAQESMAACFHGGPQPTSILSGISSHELGAGLGRKMDVEGGTRAQLKSGTCRIPAPSAAVGVPGPESWRLAQRGSEGNRRGGEGRGEGCGLPRREPPADSTPPETPPQLQRLHGLISLCASDPARHSRTAGAVS